MLDTTGVDNGEVENREEGIEDVRKRREERRLTGGITNPISNEKPIIKYSTTGARRKERKLEKHKS